MKKSRFTEQQIAYGLRQAESDVPIKEITRKMGITQATFYRWKKEFGSSRFRDSSNSTIIPLEKWKLLLFFQQ
jgi:transposase-like protein